MHISFVVMLFAVAGSFNKPQEDWMHIYFIFIVWLMLATGENGACGPFGYA